MQLFTEPISALGLMSTNMNTSTERQNQLETQHLRNLLGSQLLQHIFKLLSTGTPATLVRRAISASEAAEQGVQGTWHVRTGLGVAGRFRVQGLGCKV